MEKITSDQIRAALELMRAVIEAVRDAGRIPEGTIYAALCGSLSHSAFESMMARILGTGLVRREPSHLLVWVG